MTEPVIVDTSVWIDFFRGNETEEVRLFSEYLQNNDPVYICPVIIQEILQGIKDEEEYNLIKGYLFVLNILNDDGIEVAIGAAEIFRNLRQKGLTIRKSNDCIIAYYAIKYSLKILHCDRDFDTILNHYRSY